MANHCEVRTSLEPPYTCGQDAIVGWGPKPLWMCLDHYQQALGEARRLIDQAAELLEGHPVGGGTL